MNVLIIHNKVDSGSDASYTNKILTDTELLGYPIIKALVEGAESNGYNEISCDDPDYGDFCDDMDNIPAPVFPCMIDKVVTVYTLVY